MTEEVARAFTLRALQDSQIHELREMESKLPLPTQCFTSSQIAKDFLNDHRIEVDEIEIKTMESLWLDFYTKVLYPQQQAEELLHPQWCCTGKDQEHHTCSMMNCHHPWDDRCKTAAQEMWQWEDYVLQYYKPPQVRDRGVAASIRA